MGKFSVAPSLLSPESLLSMYRQSGAVLHKVARELEKTYLAADVEHPEQPVAKSGDKPCGLS
jgi:hypothetical protein